MLCNILKDIDAVFFDMDGTIIDSMWMWHEIDTEYLGNHHIEIPDCLQEMIEGKNFYETAVYFKETFQIPDSIEKIMLDWNEMAMDKYLKEVPLKPGFLSFLNQLKAAGLHLGIATSNSRELTYAVLKKHGILEYFDIIVTGNDGLPGKPAPEVYLACAKACQVAPNRCLVFEDIIQGLMAGKSAGMKTCAVYDEAAKASDDKKHELADYYIQDYSVLSEALQ